ncbi:MAG: hypothetical protein ACJA0U_001788 [Salibacteraceae bacterium]|jgi:hypothetical protein
MTFNLLKNNTLLSVKYSDGQRTALTLTNPSNASQWTDKQGDKGPLYASLKDEKHVFVNRKHII